MKRLRNSRRVDREDNNTHAWLVQVERNHQSPRKLFSDSIYGGKRKALQAAIQFRDETLANAAVRCTGAPMKRSGRNVMLLCATLLGALPAHADFTGVVVGVADRATITILREQE